MNFIRKRKFLSLNEFTFLTTCEIIFSTQTNSFIPFYFCKKNNLTGSDYLKIYFIILT